MSGLNYQLIKFYLATASTWWAVLAMNLEFRWSFFVTNISGTSGNTYKCKAQRLARSAKPKF